VIWLVVVRLGDQKGGPETRKYWQFLNFDFELGFGTVVHV